MTIHPRFSGTVPIFYDVPEKITDLPSRTFVPFLAWCPDLPISAVVCLRIGGRKVAKILSVYTMAAGAPPGACRGSSWRSTRSQVGPPQLVLVALAPYDSHFWGFSRITVPKLWSRYNTNICPGQYEASCRLLLIR